MEGLKSKTRPNDGEKKVFKSEIEKRYDNPQKTVREMMEEGLAKVEEQIREKPFYEDLGERI